MNGLPTSGTPAGALDADIVKGGCTKFLNGHPPQTIRDYLADVTDALDGSEYPDTYGSGRVIEEFERDIAQLLGKEAAVFMPSGTMAQAAALRVHAERSGRFTVALHPKSHLVVSEENAYQTLHPLRGVLIGDQYTLFTLSDLEKVREKIGTLLIELPDRGIGSQLRSWEELVSITTWARSNGITLHLDGARLWEAQSYYKQPYPKITELFDSVYVSFYKILNGIAGCALVGSKAVIDEARLWQHRQGGRLVHQYPMIVSAKRGLEKYLPRIPRYCERAREIASILSTLQDVETVPDPPQTNQMYVYVRGDLGRLQHATLRVASETHVWWGFNWRPTGNPTSSFCELTIGEGACEISDDAIRTAFSSVLEYAGCQKA